MFNDLHKFFKKKKILKSYTFNVDIVNSFRPNTNPKIHSLDIYSISDKIVTGPNLSKISNDLELENLKILMKKFTVYCHTYELKSDKNVTIEEMLFSCNSQKINGVLKLKKFLNFRIFQLCHGMKFNIDNYEKFKNLKGIFKKSILFFQDLYYYICIVIK